MLPSPASTRSWASTGMLRSHERFSPGEARVPRSCSICSNITSAMLPLSASAARPRAERRISAKNRAPTNHERSRGWEHVRGGRTSGRRYGSPSGRSTPDLTGLRGAAYAPSQVDMAGEREATPPAPRPSWIRWYNHSQVTVHASRQSPSRRIGGPGFLVLGSSTGPTLLARAMGVHGAAGTSGPRWLPIPVRCSRSRMSPESLPAKRGKSARVG